MNQVTTFNASAPMVIASDMYRLGEILPHARDMIASTFARDRALEALPRLREFASTQLQSVQAAIARAREPATEKQIRDQLKMLTASWPNAKVDLAAYASLLAMDVLNAHPTIFALCEGCRVLRQNSEWLPSISKVLDAIAQDESLIRLCGDRLPDLPRRIREIEQEQV